MSITRPEQKELPAQRINIDICSIPSYDIKPLVLRNPYGVDMGTSGLIIQAQSREEILADKIIAFALRPNRIKNRDLWDIAWLKQQNVQLPLKLVPRKVADHRRRQSEFLQMMTKRSRELLEDSGLHKEFIHEMKRFLPPRIIAETIEKAPFWEYLVQLVSTECAAVVNELGTDGKPAAFRM